MNSANIARECAVSAPAVREYFQILVDTLLGRYLPAYTKRPKRRMIQARKFYFADVGVVNVLARRGRIEPRSELFGKALESWIFHELSAFAAYRAPELRLSYWRTAAGVEVDFVLGDAEVGIEVKSTAHAEDTHLRGLRALRADQPSNKKLICVCAEARTSHAGQNRHPAGGRVPVAAVARRVCELEGSGFCRGRHACVRLLTTRIYRHLNTS